MRKLVKIVTAVAIGAFANSGSATTPEDAPGNWNQTQASDSQVSGPAKNRQGRPGRSRDFGMGQKRQGPGGPGQQKGRFGQMNPDAMAARMIKQFDNDGDQKLDATELIGLLAQLRERMAAGPRQGRGEGLGKPGQGAGQGGEFNRSRSRQRPSRDSGPTAGAEVGGDKPARPPSK